MNVKVTHPVVVQGDGSLGEVMNGTGGGGRSAPLLRGNALIGRAALIQS
jgi:hypothetical protein